MQSLEELGLVAKHDSSPEPEVTQRGVCCDASSPLRGFVQDVAHQVVFLEVKQPHLVVACRCPACYSGLLQHFPLITGIVEASSQEGELVHATV